MILNRIIIAAILFFATTTIAAAQIYVSPEGTDAATGSETAPFASLARAARAAEETPGPDTIWCRAGLYQITDPISISGAEGILIKAFGDEKPCFRGSTPITGWKRATGSAILAKVSPAARKRLVVADLARQGITDYGNPINENNRPVLYCNGEEQMLARYPNKGFITAGRALGETIIPPVSNGNSGAEEGYFEYNDPRVARWADEKDPKVGGYWFWDWDDSYYSVTEINTVEGSMRVSKGSMFRHGLRYFGLNLLCEIDAPGEWYLDRDDGKLYWFPPEGINPVRDDVEVTMSMVHGAPLMAFTDCCDVTVEGLTLCQSRGGAIKVKDGRRCSIIDCMIEHFGTTAIKVTGGYGHRIDGCVVRHLGGAGVLMGGGDRRDLIHADFEMSNTLVEDWERFSRTYRGAYTAEGCGIHLHHCEFRDAPSSAFSLSGNDLLAEFNIIEDVAKESDDQGGFDLYLNPSMRGLVMRYNHWKDIHYGTHYGTAGIRLDDLITGVQIYGNIFERCGSREFGAIQIHGGSENVIEDNLFYDCLQAVSLAPYGADLWKETYDSIQDIMFKEVDIRSYQYLLRYPEIREFGKNIDQNIIRNNLLVDCAAKYFVATGSHGATAAPQIESNLVEMNSDGHPAEYFCTKDILHPLGIRTIPVGEMGIKRNKWLGK